MKYELNKKSNGPIYVTEEDIMKENSNCPDSEKSGTGPGSCGGSASKDKKNSTKANKPPNRFSDEHLQRVFDTHLSGKIEESAITDFTESNGKKPSDSEILHRGMVIAKSSGIKDNKDQIDFANNYSDQYNKAWKNAAKAIKDNEYDEGDY